METYEEDALIVIKNDIIEFKDRLRMHWSSIVILIENRHENWHFENKRPLWIQIERQQAIENVLWTSGMFFYLIVISFHFGNKIVILALDSS
jgi:hypothetical protein